MQKSRFVPDDVMLVSMPPRYKVIETKVWERDDGVLVMPYALAKTRKGVPWRTPSEEERWRLVTYYTVRDNMSGTIGTPSPYESPWPTRPEAQAWVDAQATASKRHHATKKSPAQLQREIDETLAGSDFCERCKGTGSIPVPTNEPERFGKATHLVCAYCGGSGKK